MELRIRPKSDYLHKANFEELYVLTTHWRSDMEYYCDETRFLNNLVNKYFIWLIEDGNIEKVQSLSNKLSILISKKKDIYKKIDKHIVHLEELMENSFAQDEKIFRDEHLILENQFAEFVKDFRVLKKEIFEVTEHVIAEKKIKHLLTN